jgi:hypothetical protein
MKYFTHDVFGNVGEKNYFLRKVQEYHDETYEPIYFSTRIRKKPGCLNELELLNNIRVHLNAENTDLVKEFLSLRTIKTARDTYVRSQYYKYKLEIVFIENAVRQIQDYDPFFLTMDDIHESDALLLDLITKKMYYEEKLLS